MAALLCIVQQNFSGSDKTMAEIKKFVLREPIIDVVVMHEPFTVDGKVENFLPESRIITGAKEGEIPLTAIMIANRLLSVKPISELCSDRCLCVKIGTEIGDIFLVSLYSPLSENIERCLETMQELENYLVELPIIICMDANARSVWWSNADGTDERGEKLEDAILKHSLCVLNRKDPLGMTYDGISHRDLTLVTSDVIDRVHRWEAVPDCTTAPQRTIWIEVFLKDWFNDAAKDGTYRGNGQEYIDYMDDDGEMRYVDPFEEYYEYLEDLENEERKENVNPHKECHDYLDNEGQVGNGNPYFAPLNETQLFTKHLQSIENKELPWLEDSSLKSLRRRVCRLKKKMLQSGNKIYYVYAESRFMNLRRIYFKKARLAKIQYLKGLAQSEGESGEWCDGWKKVENDKVLDFEFNGSVTSLEGSTTTWCQDSVVIIDKSEKDNSLNNNNNNDGV